MTILAFNAVLGGVILALALVPVLGDMRDGESRRLTSLGRTFVALAGLAFVGLLSTAWLGTQEIWRLADANQSQRQETERMRHNLEMATNEVTFLREFQEEAFQREGDFEEAQQESELAMADAQTAISGLKIQLDMANKETNPFVKQLENALAISRNVNAQLIEDNQARQTAMADMQKQLEDAGESVPRSAAWYPTNLANLQFPSGTRFMYTSPDGLPPGNRFPAMVYVFAGTGRYLRMKASTGCYWALTGDDGVTLMRRPDMPGEELTVVGFQVDRLTKSKPGEYEVSPATIVCNGRKSAEHLLSYPQGVPATGKVTEY